MGARALAVAAFATILGRLAPAAGAAHLLLQAFRADVRARVAGMGRAPGTIAFDVDVIIDDCAGFETISARVRVELDAGAHLRAIDFEWARAHDTALDAEARVALRNDRLFCGALVAGCAIAAAGAGP